MRLALRAGAREIDVLGLIGERLDCGAVEQHRVRVRADEYAAAWKKPVVIENGYGRIGLATRALKAGLCKLATVNEILGLVFLPLHCRGELIVDRVALGGPGSPCCRLPSALMNWRAQ